MELDADATGEKLAIGAGVLTALAAFMPWVSVSVVSVTGIDGDGVFTLLFGLAAIAVVLAREWSRVDRIAVGVLGALTVLIAAGVYANLGDQSGTFATSSAIGLHLTVLGGLGLIAAAVVDRVLE